MYSPSSSRILIVSGSEFPARQGLSRRRPACQCPPGRTLWVAPAVADNGGQGQAGDSDLGPSPFPSSVRTDCGGRALGLRTTSYQFLAFLSRFLL